MLSGGAMQRPHCPLRVIMKRRPVRPPTPRPPVPDATTIRQDVHEWSDCGCNVQSPDDARPNTPLHHIGSELDLGGQLLLVFKLVLPPRCARRRARMR